MKTAYLALGTNIEPREEYLTSALEILRKDNNIHISQQSSIYETAPVGYADQADFLNMVIELETYLSALNLLELCQTIERQLGRKKLIRFGPRTIDLDILVYNQENRKTDVLTIPHPRMHERAFVLIPLHEIAPELLLYKGGKTVSDYIKALSESDIKDVTRWTHKGSAEE
ncbi:2-amino-4-hydroxy-6-hydroxymethyldihydropteridine diphosphokinase [Virgibacillus litoralis]|uniref:2-amino-4-hydroxy-6-hydroxymethyldihydropteridine diphosphokinase n=1 Tax=Virgibacillus litoralis TaxID=578221 RepID=A0ABS4HHS8_9BACI|nr:2-amino-4-hydroxy-6-hydroxymethyldihydropteridine diphosphokinase [Virgibacillus litoralis]MBP1950484.1 2-amino-4-hydroxy-6-hydroxymethyldihydropteridine diphosphokinase [Virgibacillus litoralis]